MEIIIFVTVYYLNHCCTIMNTVNPNKNTCFKGLDLRILLVETDNWSKLILGPNKEEAVHQNFHWLDLQSYYTI